MREPVILLSSRGIMLLLLFCTLCSALLLVGTAWFHRVWIEWRGGWESLPAFYQALALTNLATEDVLATWFSSMLLLAVAGAALICFIADQAAEPRTRWKYGWLGMAAIFVLLSLDELGSVHERMPAPEGMIGWLVWLGPFLLAIPIYMLLFGWFRVRRSPRAFLLLCLGVLLFATIPVQEFIEVNVKAAAGGEDWIRPTTDLLLEEGAELAGMVCFLAGFLFYAHARGAAAEGPIRRIEVRPSQQWLKVLYLIFFAGCLLGLLAAQHLLPNNDAAGTAENWFPSALSSVAAGCALLRAVQSQNRVVSGSWAMLFAAALGISAFMGGNLFAWAGQLDGVRYGLAAFTLLAGAAVAMAERSPVVVFGCFLWASVNAAAVLFAAAPAIWFMVATSAALIPLLVGFTMLSSPAKGWPAPQDSNLQPPGSKPGTLSG